MINLTLGTNTTRTTILVPETETPKQSFQNNNIEIGTAQVYLDSSILNTAGMNKSYAEHGIKDTAMLIAVIKQDNG